MAAKKSKQLAAGTIKEVVEENDGGEGQALVPGGNGQTKPNGLQHMNEKDVNDYLDTLTTTKQPPEGLGVLELGALTQFRGINQEAADTERRLTRTQTLVEQLKSQLARLNGQSEAYVNLLVLAEDHRRGETQAEA